MQDKALKVIYIKQVATSFFWGGMYVAGRVVVAAVPVMSAGFLRFLIAGGILSVLWLNGKNRVLPAGKQWLPLFLLAFTGIFLYSFFFFNGMQTVSAGRAAIIITTNPTFTAILARIIFKEPMPLRKIIGITLAGAGAFYVVSHGQPLDLFNDAISRGDLFLFGGALSWTAYSLCNKLVRDLSAVTTITFSCLIGCLMLAPFALHEGILTNIKSYTWQSWAALLYIGVCCTVLSFVWFNQGIRYLGAQRASLFINLVPGITVVMGALFLGEAITPDIVVGVLTVCFGIFLANAQA